MVFRHRSADPEACRVCGGEMAIVRMGGGEEGVYRCAATTARVSVRLGPGERDEADWRHYLDSEVRVFYVGDEEVSVAVEELRRRRQAMGEDVSVPVGATYFPFGHGQGLCNLRWVHRGADSWELAMDPNYDHDPTHASLIVDTGGMLPNATASA